MERFQVTVSKTKDERIDGQPYSGFNRKRTRGIPEAEKQYRMEMNDRILTITERVHKEAGPIPYCNCATCENYYHDKTCGPYHDMIGCSCYVCEQKRITDRLLKYGLKTAKRLKERQKRGRSKRSYCRK